MLQSGFLRHKWGFEFFELGNIKHPLGKAVVNPINLRFKRSQVGFEAVNFLLLLECRGRRPPSPTGIENKKPRDNETGVRGWLHKLF